MARLRYLQNKRSGTAGTIVKSTSKLHFYDEGMYIYASADGALEIVSDTSITLTAPTVNVDVTASSVFTDPVTITYNCTDSTVSDLTITSISASTTGGTTIKPLYVDATMSATGGVGRAIEGKLTVSGKLGSWGNAIKGYLDVTGTGCAGLISGVCAELRLPSASLQTGTYAVLELNWVGQASTHTEGALTGCHTSLIYANVGGGTAGDFDARGYIFEIEGLSDSSTNAWYDNTLRIAIGDTAWYIPLSTAEGTYTTAYPISVTVAGATAFTVGTSDVGISMTGAYTTGALWVETTMAEHDDYAIYVATSCADTSDTVVPLYVNSVTTAACKARAAEFRLSPTAALGQWANATKSYLDLTSASGGLGLIAGLCAEVKLPSQEMTGTITVLEIELSALGSFAAGQGTGSNCVSFINTNLAKTGGYEEVDDYAFFLNIQGLTAGDTHMLYGNTLKCAIGTVKYYLPFSTAQASFTTAYPISSSNATKGIAFTAATTNYISFDHVGTAGTSIALHFVDSYNGMVIETGTLGTNTGITLSVDNHRPVSFLFDDGGSALVAENYRGVLSRIYLSQDQTNQVAIRAMRGHIKIADDKDFNVGANEFGAINGVEGYIETTGTNSIVVGATSRVAAIHGYVELRQNTSITSGGILTAVFAELGMNTETITNECAGVWIDVIDSAHGWVGVWPVGLKIADSASTTGIEIGDCTTGITLDGTITTGLNIASGATTGIAIAAASTAAIAISGANADGILFTGTYTSGACIAIGTYGGASIHLVDSRPLFYFSSLLNASEATSALRPMFQQTRIQPKVAISSVASVFSYVCRLEFLGGTSSNTTYSANMPSGAISGEIWSDGVANTEVTAGVLSALHANMGFGANSSVTGANYCGLFIYDQTNSGASIASALHSGILIDGGSGFLTMGNAIKVTNNVTNFLYITDDGALAADVAGSPLGDIQGTASTGFIRVSVGGTTRYIALYTAN